MRVDGFRFDLASIFTRNHDGSINLKNPPVIAEIDGAPEFELRPKLAEIIARDPSQRLANFSDAAVASTNLGGVLWGFGKGLYDHATGILPKG